MERIRVLIADDEPLARKGVRMRLDAEADFEIVGECSNGRKAVEAIERLAPDLVFLDIEMPRLGGFSVIETIGANRMPAVIFVTAYDEHALRAFEVHALDYLLKPIDGARFREAIERARNRIRNRDLESINRKLSDLIQDIKKEKKYLERLAIKSGERVLLLGVDEIDWIEAADNYARIHAGKQSHLLHATMNSLESKLDPARFLRVHRSAIVNILSIRELHPLFHGEYRLSLKNGAEITSGRSYRNRLQQILKNSF